MQLRPRPDVPPYVPPSLPFPLGPPNPCFADELRVDFLNHQTFPAQALATVDDLLAQALMSTKKSTPAHRVTTLSRLVSTEYDNGVLLELCRRFESWAQRKDIQEARLDEDLWNFALLHGLVGRRDRFCFEQ